MFSISAGSRPGASTIAPFGIPASLSNARLTVDHSAASEAVQASAVVTAVLPVGGPALPNVLWGKIAEYIPCNDVLGLRSTDRKMATCVDRSIRRLSVNADRMPTMLAVLGRSAGFKHIDKLTILFPENDNFPAAIAALGRIPHEKLNLSIELSLATATRLDANGMACLRDIRPATLSVKDYQPLEPALTRLLSDLEYPVSLSGLQYWIRDTAALADLSRIARLVSLEVTVHTFSDEAASSFRQRGCLQDLHIAPVRPVYASQTVVISDTAVEQLAAIPTLRTLYIGAIRHPLGERGIEALSKNRGLRSLTIETTIDSWEDTAAVRLSENPTLVTLSVSLSGGWSHLTRMASLQDLTLLGPTMITLSEAQRFAQGAQLRTLNLSKAQFEEDALASMASAVVENLELSVRSLNAREIESLLANRNLRSLRCKVRGDFAPAIANVLALAAHPTLTSLVFRHVSGARACQAVMTKVERDAMFEGWGSHRSSSALQTTF